MSQISTIINNLVQNARKYDPQLATTLIDMLNEIDRIATIVDPAPVVQSKATTDTGTPVGGPGNVINFDYTFTGTNLILTWEAPSDGIFLYELRLGSSWSSATRLLTTATLQAVLDPILEGTTRYLIKAIDASGVNSLTAVVVDVVVPAVGAVVVSSVEINNAVILTWTAPTSVFNISHSLITRDGFQIAVVTGRFFSIQEASAGSFTYGVQPVDIAGNEGPRTELTLTVAGPTDFEIQDSLSSNFSGTKTNAKVDEDALVVCVDIVKNYQNHFIDNAWATPAAQVAAGYERWIHPSKPTATYKEVFNFGSIFQNVIVNISYNFDIIVGSFTFGLSTRVSDDNVSWSSPVTSSSFFVMSARYVEVTFTFTGNNDKALLRFHDFLVTLAVKREVDGGNAEVFAADVAGTVIAFDKPFKFVESITLTPLSTAQQTAVYDFAGGIDPPDFLALLFDDSLNRIDGVVSWKARGVL